MEGSVGASSNSSLLGLEYRLQWQVLVCALILILSATLEAIFLLRNRSIHLLKPADLWAPCWTNLHTRILLFYRAFAFAAVAFSLFQTVAAPLDYSYSFSTPTCYKPTTVSGQGCRIESKSGETDKFLKKDSKDVMYETTTATVNRVGGFTKLEVHHNQVAYQEQQVGSIGNIM